VLTRPVLEGCGLYQFQRRGAKPSPLTVVRRQRWAPNGARAWRARSHRRGRGNEPAVQPRYRRKPPRAERFCAVASQSITDIYKDNRRKAANWRELESPERKAQRMADMAEDRGKLQDYIDQQTAAYESNKAA
jgi:hypothetical protein